MSRHSSRGRARAARRGPAPAVLDCPGRAHELPSCGPAPHDRRGKPRPRRARGGRPSRPAGRARPGRPRRGAGVAARRGRRGGPGGRDLRREHRLRQLADVHVPARPPPRAPAQPRPQPRGGVGRAARRGGARALLLLRANVLAKGYSGVRLETLELLVELLNAGVHPVVPSQGSVGASGDLAPLAHLALVADRRGRRAVLTGRRALRRRRRCARAGSRRSCLEAKEGLALINGTQAHDGGGGARAGSRPSGSPRPPTSPAR